MFTKPTLGSPGSFPPQFGRLVDIVEGPINRNFLRNGDFQIAQRGTSLAGLTTQVYTLDGWVNGAAGTSTITQQAHTVGQTEVPGNPPSYMRVQRTVAAGAANEVCSNRIELPARLSGKTITVSFYARVGSGSKALTFNLVSSGVTPAINTVDNTFTATTTFTEFKATINVPAMTAATSSAYLEFRIREGASFGTFTFDISDAQLEQGSESTGFARLAFHEQLAWARRFYWKTFPYATPVAQNSGISSGAISYIAVLGGGTTFNGVHVRLPVQMRASPTATFYNPAAANAKWRNLNTAADSSTSAASASNLSEDGFLAINQQVAGDAVAHTICVHVTLTAEL